MPGATVDARLSPLLLAAASAPRVSVARLLGGRPLAVVAPHPDDETLGCGALLHDAARAGTRCCVVCLTDGSASHRRSEIWPPHRIAQVRRSELAAAVGELAADAEVHWLGYSDCGLPTEGEEAERAVAAISGALPSGASVLAAWGGDPHVDHERGARLVAAVAAGRPDLSLLWYPIWGRFSEAPPPPQVFLVEASPGARAAKQRALACHATQMTRLIDDDPEGFVMDLADQAHFLSHPEIVLAD